MLRLYRPKRPHISIKIYKYTCIITFKTRVHRPWSEYIKCIENAKLFPCHMYNNSKSDIMLIQETLQEICEKIVIKNYC